MSDLWWVRRDLGGLSAAATAAGHDAPAVFVEDPRFDLLRATPRGRFLSGALEDLARRRGELFLRRTGPTAVELLAASRSHGAREVHAEREFTPLGRRIEAEVAGHLAAGGVRLVLHASRLLVAPGSLRSANHQRIRSFRRFYDAWVEALPSAYDDPLNEHLSPGVPQERFLPEPTRDASIRRWRNWSTLRLDEYPSMRDLPAVDGTTRLSAALRFGLVDAGRLAFCGEESLRREVAFREFFADLLFHHPSAIDHSIDQRFDRCWPAGSTEHFEAFVAGRTGFPLVDAGIRQLLATGWMHNRVRMVVASFLVKDLHLPWQWGAAFFQRHLLDGDVASNSGNWQWVAGSFPDAAPFFRVMNPVLQSERFDPSGSFIRTWVPELEAVPAEHIHDPSRRCARLPDGYPAAMLDHSEGRVRALEWFKSLPS